MSVSDLRGGTSVRRLLVQLHLWLGLSVGLLFVLTGLTGAALVFYPEIDTALDGRLRAQVPHAQPASWEQVYQTLRTRHDANGFWTIEVPADGGVIAGRFNGTPGADGERGRFIVSVDPTSLKVLRDVPWRGYAMTWIYDLHQQLLMKQKVGRTVMAWFGIAMIALFVSGVIVWWPRPGDWKRNLTVARVASTRRRMLEIHQLSGVYAGLFLVAIAATGIMIGFGDATRKPLSAVSTLETLPSPSSKPAEGRAPIGLDRAVVAAKAHYPQAKVVWMDPPHGAEGAYQIRLRQPDEPSPRFPRTYVWIDQYDGAVLAARTTRGESAGDTVLTWQHSIHNGEAFGLFGRIVVLLLGLLPAVMFATGLWRWLRRNAR